jgi:hypothetical protein
MSRLPMIFNREAIAADMLAGGSIMEYNSPSIRNRTVSFLSLGSMWMSLAPSLTAF